MNSNLDTAWARADELHPRLIELSHRLHEEPETAFQEYASADMVATLMESEGFDVERGACDLPTALTATYGTGDLKVGICAEYDALPDIGHACGHNVIAAAGVGAAVALAPLADRLGLTVKLIGTPAEEGGGGKVLMLDRGAFDGLAAALMVHPGPGVDIVDHRFSSQTVSHFEATFHGKAAHAAAAPTHGINAADAAVVAQVAIGQLRQQISGDLRIAGFVKEGGQRTNIIPELARLEYEVRAGTSGDLEELKGKVLNCFRGAALATGTKVDFEQTQPDYLEMRQDEWLTGAYRKALSSLGRKPIKWPSGIAASGSTDMGNVTHVLPAIQPILAIEGATAMPHTREFTAITDSPAADEAILVGAKSLAATALSLAEDIGQRAAFSAHPYTRSGSRR